MRRLRNLTAGFMPATHNISYRLDLTWINESQLQRIDPLINLLPPRVGIVRAVPQMRRQPLSGQSAQGLRASCVRECLDPVHIPTMTRRD